MRIERRRLYRIYLELSHPELVDEALRLKRCNDMLRNIVEKISKVVFEGGLAGLENADEVVHEVRKLVYPFLEEER
jgi:hypothetical protein